MLGIVLLSGLTLLVISLVGGIVLRATTTSMVDQQLATSEHAFERGMARSGYVPKKPLEQFVGQGPGAVIALVRDGVVLDAARFTSDGGQPVPPAALARIAEAAAAATPGGTFEIRLAELGNHRATVTEHEGLLLFTAIGTGAVDAAVGLHTAIALVTAAVALAVLTVGGTMIVRFTLRPLSRVAAAARAVAGSSLRADQVSVPRRLDPRDLRDEGEVGGVARALAVLLDNVDDALQFRLSSDRRMRRFLADASHELRTPLAAIRGYAELTRQESHALPPTTEFALERIESEAGRMAGLVEDLLLLARLDEGLDLRVDDVDLADIAAAALADAAAIFPDHRWRSELPEGPVVVRGDTERIHQMVANLLSNIGTHTPAGTAAVVRADLGSDGGAVLTVADDGPGIPAELAERLFERFGGVGRPASGGARSTGLGLSIVKAIVEAHHGRIRSSGDGPGATFVVEFPPARR